MMIKKNIFIPALVFVSLLFSACTPEPATPLDIDNTDRFIGTYIGTYSSHCTGTYPPCDTSYPITIVVTDGDGFGKLNVDGIQYTLDQTGHYQVSYPNNANGVTFTDTSVSRFVWNGGLGGSYTGHWDGVKQ